MLKGEPDIIPKISVIIPAYNVEKYLSQCVDSVLSQTFTDFEVILIDDGSIDNSLTICEEYIKKDSRIRVFHQSHAGVSIARNKGIEKANGEYICFVDSDDWVEENYLNDFLIKTIEGDDFLIIQPSMYYAYLNEPQKSYWRSTNYDSEEYYGSEIPKALVFSDFFVSRDGGPVCKLFKKSILNRYNIKFSSKISAYEDVIFSLKYVSRINCLCISNGKNYHYLHRDSHVSLSRKAHLYNEYLYSANEGEEAIDNLIVQFGISDLQIINVARVKMLEIRLTSIYALYSSRKMPGKNERYDLLDSLKKTNKSLVKNIYRPHDLKERLTKQILFIGPLVLSDLAFIILYRLRNLFKIFS